MENEDKVKAYFENRVHELLEEMQKKDVCGAGYLGGRLKAAMDLRMFTVKELIWEYKRFPEMSTNVRLGYRMELRNYKRLTKE